MKGCKDDIKRKEYSTRKSKKEEKPGSQKEKEKYGRIVEK